MKIVTVTRLATATALSCVVAAQAAEPVVEKVSVRAVTHFDFDRTGIRAQDQASLLADVGKMTDVTWQSVTATGHTDSIGTPAYNDKLSARRAQAVTSYLVGKGLSPTMIKAEGKGPQGPIADNASSEGRARNRRTEVEFQGVRTVSR